MADDSTEVIDMLRLAFDLEDDIEVVGTAGNGQEAVTVVTATRPDAIVLDLQMPVLSGLDAIPLIREVAPETYIVVFSSRGVPGVDDEAFRRGAHVYIEKPAEVPAILQLLRSLCHG